MNTSPSQLATSCVAALIVLACGVSCAKKKQDNFAGVDGDYDYVSGTPLPERVDGANFLASNVNRSMFQPVYFGFDSYTIEPSEQGKLQTVAQSINSSGKDIIIAGFTDERGTEEYNRALGERRAQAVRQHLIGLGVSGAKIQTVSFGEEMPADPGSGEAAWARNRRAEFGVLP